MITTASNDAFVPGGLYTVVLNRTIKANNGATLGSNGNRDVAFSFTAPDAVDNPNGNGTYSASALGSLNLFPQNNAANVPLENNIGFTVNIPVSNYAAVLSGMVLEKNGVPLTLDPTIDTSQDGDIYAPIVTDDHTLFFFPMSGSGGNTSYNLAPNSVYTLSIPAMTLVNNQMIAAQTVSFTTTANDTPSRVTPAPTSANSTDGSNLTISWTAPAGATGYNVYASEDPYWNFVQLNTGSITGLSYTTSGLNPNTAYYFRVASVNVTSEAGVSDYVTATTPAAAVSAPTVSSVATNAAGTIVTATFNKAMAALPLAPAGFTVTVDGTADLVTAVALNTDPTKIDLTLTTPLTNGQTATLDYTAGIVTAADTGALASFTAQAVTNNVPGGSSTYAVVAPTVVTGSVSDIGGQKATIGGNVTADGGAPVTERGIVYSTSPNPLITDTAATRVSDISGGTGSFSISLTGLTDITTYHVRAYAKNSAGISYGNDVTFATPASGSNPLNLLGVNLATINGSHATGTESLGASIINNRSVPSGLDTIDINIDKNIISDAAFPIVNNQTVFVHNQGCIKVKDLTANSNVSISVYRLGDGTPNDTYKNHIFFDVTLISGDSYELTIDPTLIANNGLQLGTTQPIDFAATGGVNQIITGLTVTTDTAASAITGTGATIGGNVTADGGVSVTERGIVYSTNSDPTTKDTKVVASAGGKGAFTVMLSGLTAGITYHVRAYAINSLGTSYGADVTFITSDVPISAAVGPQPAATPMVSSPVQANTAATVQAKDGTQVMIPANSLVQPLTITISLDTQTVDPTLPNIIAYDPQYTERSFGPSGTVFNAPVTLTMPFGGANIDQADIANLAIFLWQDGQWVNIGGTVDSVNKTVSVKVSHFSTYRVMAERTPVAVTTTVEERIGGSDRYETAVKIAQDYFSTGADTAVLTRGDSSADALAAVPLAKHFNAPLLLTPQDQLPDQVLTEIKTLGVKTVYIVGGEMAVSSQVANVISGQGIKIQRIAGADRFATAYEVAKLLGNTGQAVIVNGNDGAYPDALSISSWAAYNGVPILYADGTDTLPEVTTQALTELKVTRTILVGGTAVLPQSLEGLVPNPERYAGVDRYDTNTQVLSKLQPNPTQIFVATGNNFADALAGAAVAGQTNAWLILTGNSPATGSGLAIEQQQLLLSVKGVKDLHVFGGTIAVPDSTLNEIKKDLGF